MSECIFCKIIEGEIPAERVYEDEDVVAFLDANPLAEGHTLVVPREHVERVSGLDPDLAGRHFRPVPEIAGAVQEAVDADGATMAWNEGSAAGQEVPHAHLHIVPRWDSDRHGPIHALFQAQGEVEVDEADLAQSVRAELQAARA
jgi:histidine triad (HIT) family protein